MRRLPERERLRLLERVADRGETERRGDRDLEGVGERGAAGGGDRVRLRPREADLDDMPEEKREKEVGLITLNKDLWVEWLVVA